MAAGIYQIRNIINDKIYIGHTQDIQQRLRDHKSSLIRKSGVNKKLTNSVIKYGIENFKFEILSLINTQGMDKYQSRKFLTAWEQYYVDIYDPEYNIKKNSVGLIPINDWNVRKIYCFNKKGELIGEYTDMKHASNATGVCHADVSAVVNKRYKHSKGLIFSYDKEPDLTFHLSKSKECSSTQKIAVFDKYEKYIETLSSMREVLRKYGVNSNIVRKIAEGRACGPTKSGYIFKYLEEIDKPISFVDRPKVNVSGRNNPNCKSVSQYDLGGNFIKEWSCIKEAAIENNINPKTLTGYLNKGINIVNNFLFKKLDNG